VTRITAAERKLNRQGVAVELLCEAMTNKLSKQHRRWLKRLATGKIPDHLWPVGIDARGRLNISEPGQPPPKLEDAIREDPRERAKAPLPLP
jgi:hypothetical protein